MTRYYQFLRRQSFVLLFVALVTYVLVQPFFAEAERGGALAIFTTIVQISAIVALSRTRLGLLLGLGFGLPLFIHLWAAAAEPMGVPIPKFLVDPGSYRIGTGSGVLFHGYMAVLLLMYVFRSVHVNVNMIAGAACVYLLAGVTWGFSYELVDSIAPNSFTIAPALCAEENPPVQLYLYFSFTTLTTLGYGDMSPVHPVARALSNLEAIFGVLFTTIVIARFVGLHLTAASFRR